MNLPTLPFARILCISVLSLGCVPGLQQVARADSDDVITYRQLIMKELDASSAAVGMIVSGAIPADTLSQQTRVIAISAKSALKAFEAKVPGGEAKPEVWTKWADFSKRMQVFVQKTEEMAKASETGNVDTVTGLMVDALTCKQCHDVYRNKKK
jgi:cytochrome c556